MVLLHYKKTDHNQFLFETLGTRPIGEIIDELVESKPWETQRTT